MGVRMSKILRYKRKSKFPLAGLFAIFLIIIIIMGASASRAAQESANPVLRIGLVRQFGSAAEVYVSAPESARLVDGDGHVKANGPALWRARVGSGREITVMDAADSVAARGSTVRIVIGEHSHGEFLGLSLSAPITRPSGQALNSRSRALPAPARFRGEIELACGPQSGSLRIVNEVPLEEYLRGVVGREIGADAPGEALKAQSVAARTYALKNRGRFSAAGYDMTDTTACQVYGGVEAEAESSDRAVRETCGIVLKRSGALIEADYYDDCGGITAPGDSPDDFPPSVVDGPGSYGLDYCAQGSSHAWKLSVSAAEMGLLVRRFVDNVSEEKLTHLEVLSVDVSGRARTVRITGSKGTVKDISGSEFRGLVGYNRLKSTLFKIARNSEGVYQFEGRGYGHGHGLCQAGAMGMAAPPYSRSYRDILAHYFPGADMVTLSDMREKMPGGETGKNQTKSRKDGHR